jgi:gas vesicle protein
VAITSRIRNAGKAAGAVSAAPYLSRFTSDGAVSSSVRDFLTSADRLYADLADGNIGGLHISRRAAREAAGRRERKALLIGAGLGMGIGGLVTAALIYPRSRREMARVVRESRERAAAAAHDARDEASDTAAGVRHRASSTLEGAREKVTGTVHDVRDRISGRLGEAGETVGQAVDEAGAEASDAVAGAGEKAAEMAEQAEEKASDAAGELPRAV